MKVDFSHDDFMAVDVWKERVNEVCDKCGERRIFNWTSYQDDKCFYYRDCLNCMTSENVLILNYSQHKYFHKHRNDVLNAKLNQKKYFDALYSEERHTQSLWDKIKNLLFYRFMRPSHDD